MNAPPSPEGMLVRVGSQSAAISSPATKSVRSAPVKGKPSAGASVPTRRSPPRLSRTTSNLKPPSERCCGLTCGR